jgi:hypothetical protein
MDKKQAQHQTPATTRWTQPHYTKQNPHHGNKLNY